MSDMITGGDLAIEAAHRLLARERRGNVETASITVQQAREQMALAVDRVMTEGSVYDPDLAALALKQAWGDVSEAIFLMRAYRTTLPRFGATLPVDTCKMDARRRVSSAYKDLPGGQVLGATFDYSLRLIDFALSEAEPAPCEDKTPATVLDPASFGKALRILADEDLIEPIVPDDPDREVGDVTSEPVTFPASRDARLQAIARGDEGFIVGLAYSSMRGYGANHPMLAEARSGEVEVEFFAPELGFAVGLGPIAVTECDMVHQFILGKDGKPRLTHGYGITFGRCERKAMAMAIVDRALRSAELGEDIVAPVQDQEFVLSHLDNLAAGGHVEHLKMPHYVDFQAELILLRQMQADAGNRQEPTEQQSDDPLVAAAGKAS